MSRSCQFQNAEWKCPLEPLSGGIYCPFHNLGEVDSHEISQLVLAQLLSRKPHHSNWSGIQIQDFNLHERSKAKGLKFHRSRFKDNNLSRTFLEEVDWIQCHFERLIFSESVLEECLIQQSELIQISANKLNLLSSAIESSFIESEQDFIETDFKNCSFSGNEINLAFVNCRFDQILFQDNQMHRLVFENCDLISCQFESNQGHIQFVRCRFQDTEIPASNDFLEILEIASI